MKFAHDWGPKFRRSWLFGNPLYNATALIVRRSCVANSRFRPTTYENTPAGKVPCGEGRTSFPYAFFICSIVEHGPIPVAVR